MPDFKTPITINGADVSDSENVSYDPTGFIFTATDVQGALLESEIRFATHGHSASNTSFSPSGLAIVSGTNVQAAIAQLDAQAAGRNIKRSRTTAFNVSNNVWQTVQMTTTVSGDSSLASGGGVVLTAGYWWEIEAAVNWDSNTTGARGMGVIFNANVDGETIHRMTRTEINGGVFHSGSIRVAIPFARLVEIGVHQNSGATRQLPAGLTFPRLVCRRLEPIT